MTPAEQVWHEYSHRIRVALDSKPSMTSRELKKLRGVSGNGTQFNTHWWFSNKADRERESRKRNNNTRTKAATS